MSEDCPHCVFEKTESNCRGCFEGSHYKPKPVTHYDLLVSKSPEELAKHLCCPWSICQNMDVECNKCLLDWLKEEAKE